MAFPHPQQQRRISPPFSSVATASCRDKRKGKVQGKGEREGGATKEKRKERREAGRRNRRENEGDGEGRKKTRLIGPCGCGLSSNEREFLWRILFFKFLSALLALMSVALCLHALACLLPTESKRGHQLELELQLVVLEPRNDQCWRIYFLLPVSHCSFLSPLLHIKANPNALFSFNVSLPFSDHLFYFLRTAWTFQKNLNFNIFPTTTQYIELSYSISRALLESKGDFLGNSFPCKFCR